MKVLPLILVAAAIFTGIELVALNVWFAGSTPAVTFSAHGQVGLTALIFLEHVVSMVFGYNIGTGRALFSIP